jgi:hypothetical protein
MARATPAVAAFRHPGQLDQAGVCVARRTGRLPETRSFETSPEALFPSNPAVPTVVAMVVSKTMRDDWLCAEWGGWPDAGAPFRRSECGFDMILRPCGTGWKLDPGVGRRDLSGECTRMSRARERTCGGWWRRKKHESREQGAWPGRNEIRGRRKRRAEKRARQCVCPVNAMDFTMPAASVAASSSSTTPNRQTEVPGRRPRERPGSNRRPVDPLVASGLLPAARSQDGSNRTRCAARKSPPPFSPDANASEATAGAYNPESPTISER